ncbi:S-adenosylmethionine synthetase, partial [Opitutia bacterium SCGC AG-212-L18]
MDKDFIFSSESVGEGHPDKVADYISDSILDACLTQNPNSRVACETLVKSNCVYLAGEITAGVHIDYDAVVRQAIREIGYTYDDDVFHADRVFIANAITPQSMNIAPGIDAGGAGDQGIMFGYACKDTEELMPAPILYAHRLARELAHARRHFAPWIRPDCKTQVALRYENRKPAEIVNIVLSTQHAPDMKHADIVEFCREDIIKKVLPSKLLTKNTQYFINPTGPFVIGGPAGDAGLTGRKIMVDSYGGWAHHGGGCFSGKDPSKVDRSAAYMCRWVAKNIVAAGLADEVEIQVSYAIGRPEPTSLNVSTFGTGIYPDSEIKKKVESLFSFKPV